jgi:hypothetical protein
VAVQDSSRIIAATARMLLLHNERNELDAQTQLLTHSACGYPLWPLIAQREPLFCIAFY